MRRSVCDLLRFSHLTVRSMAPRREMGRRLGWRSAVEVPRKDEGPFLMLLPSMPRSIMADDDRTTAE